MEEKSSKLGFKSHVLVLSHYLLILFIFPHLQFTAGEFENFHCMEFEDFPVQTVNIILILANQ